MDRLLARRYAASRITDTAKTKITAKKTGLIKVPCDGVEVIGGMVVWLPELATATLRVSVLKPWFSLSMALLPVNPEPDPG